MDEILCFDRVVVSEPIVEGERVRVGYATHRRGQKSERSELVLHYHGIDLDSPEMRGVGPLLKLAAAQPVVSLGPFAREIVFEFPFEVREIALLKDLFRSVAREIYLNRIVQDGSCVKDQARPSHFAPRKTYCQAKLDAATYEERSVAQKHPADRFAVLVTGGPESLLSYGLLREIGVPVLPILLVDGPREARRVAPIERAFESSGVPYARVTSNLASVLAGFADSMKILKAEALKKSPDLSPLRVYLQGPAIFLSLPILLGEKIPNLVVAKEPRPPLAEAYKGVHHYRGLYDRTRYFDDFLDRAFRGRGWDVHPFSLSLALSELVVERILGTRYPDLFPLQSWCPSPVRSTAAGASPCGKCEACLLMLTVVLAEGLGPDKVGLRERDLEKLLKHGPPVTDETRPLLEHAALKLLQRGFLPNPLPRGGWEALVPKAHPHLEKVSFDNRRAFLDTIPAPLRRKVYRIFLEYARGSVVLSEQGWMEFSLLESKEADREKILF